MPTTDLIEDFPLREARRIVKDLQAPNPLVYWADFLASNIIGWSAVAIATFSPLLSVLQIVAVVVATIALYRAVIFIHELSHLKRDSFKLFRFVWNVTCGIPLMVPSFTYAGVHIDHHKPQIYGTHEDGEYLPIGIESPWKLPLYLIISLVPPLVFAFRFIVLTPLSYLHPKLRALVWRHVSSLTVDLAYKRPEATKQNDRTWLLQEWGAFFYGVALLAAVYFGLVPLAFLGVWYAVTVLIFMLNAVRTLVAHAYKNPGDNRMSRAQEFYDSIDVPGNALITPMWAPVGLRFHATHHLFPSMPYHNLGAARRKLIAELADNEPYLRSTRKNLRHALVRLWREAKAAQQAEKQKTTAKEQTV
ncbi:fatty acid desaturase family protein [Kordiimonas pumila]|uniref:Fatty acid desaturase family protein n=1 Tax=Kordiimonas pumila TaxID=2161677 RepID=A0ABV7D8G1_9PROT|nr:fatty acid desaturase [Kordiimonas pumila]